MRYRVVRVTEQHYVSIFFSCLWSVRIKALLFRVVYMARLVTNQQNSHFSLSFIFSLLEKFVVYLSLIHI